MDINQFVKEKRDEILALAARHQAGNVRLVKPSEQDSADATLKLIVNFDPSPQSNSNYLDALVEFQEDLEVWLGITVHVYDANGFKGDDGQAFLNDAVAL